RENHIELRVTRSRPLRDIFHNPADRGPLLPGGGDHLGGIVHADYFRAGPALGKQACAVSRSTAEIGNAVNARHFKASEKIAARACALGGEAKVLIRIPTGG